MAAYDIRYTRLNRISSVRMMDIGDMDEESSDEAETLVDEELEECSS